LFVFFSSMLWVKNPPANPLHYGKPITALHMPLIFYYIVYFFKKQCISWTVLST
jgi:hypothetical protein